MGQPKEIQALYHLPVRPKAISNTKTFKPPLTQAWMDKNIRWPKGHMPLMADEINAQLPSLLNARKIEIKKETDAQYSPQRRKMFDKADVTDARFFDALRDIYLKGDQTPMNLYKKEHDAVRARPDFPKKP